MRARDPFLPARADLTAGQKWTKALCSAAATAATAISFPPARSLPTPGKTVV